jgi:hypothetical protein
LGTPALVPDFCPAAAGVMMRIKATMVTIRIMMREVFIGHLLLKLHFLI